MKKSFRKFVSIAAAVSMLGTVASISVSADEAEASTDVVYVEDGATSVENFAFSGQGANYVFVPASVTAEGLGNQSFLTSEAIDKFLVEEGLQFDAENQKAIEEYIAKVIKFGGKEADWTEDELKTVDEWFEKNLKLAGFDTTNEEASAGDAVVALIKEYNKGADSKLDMSEKSTANFGIWAAALPYGGLTVVAPIKSATQEYATARKDFDLNFKVLGDTSDDGQLNVRDAAYIAQNLAAKKANPVWADYSYDKDVNVRDAARIAQDLAAGKIAK